MTGSLPAATARLWRRLSEAPQLAGFYLIGGTALSLRIGHRQSEDLELGQQINLDVAFSRLLSGTLPQSDPGYDSLLSQAPTLGQITDFFREAIADWKIRAAERLLREPPN